MKNQYDEALLLAREEQKLILVNFTGYACTNCHWMKANMFTRPEIAASMKDFVLVDLFADGLDEASEQNQEIQASRFNTIAIPFCAIVDAEGNTLSTFAGLTRDAGEWPQFLENGTRPELAYATLARASATTEQRRRISCHDAFLARRCSAGAAWLAS